MSIIHDIISCFVAYRISTNRLPTTLYLGRNEMRQLGRWAFENGFQDKDETAAKEGSARPKIMGMLVFEVNDDGKHICCSDTTSGET